MNASPPRQGLPAQRPPSPAKAQLSTKAQPWIVSIYGLAKKGKTAMALRCMPEAAGITAARLSLAPLRGLTGLDAEETVVGHLLDAVKASSSIAKGRPRVFDDVGVMAERSLRSYEKRGVTGWKLWGAIHRDLYGLRAACMDADASAIWTFHEVPPHTDDSGIFYPGGPKLPSKNLTPVVPAISALVARAVVGGGGLPPLWRGGLECDPMGLYYGGDRFAILPKKGPQAIREWAVAAATLGHPVEVPLRAHGLEWMDDVVGWLAEGFAAGGTPKQAIAALADDSPSMPLHLRAWIVEDAYARSFYRAAHDNLFAAFAGGSKEPAAETKQKTEAPGTPSSESEQADESG